LHTLTVNEKRVFSLVVWWISKYTAMSAWLVDFSQQAVDYAMYGVGEWKMTGRHAVSMKTKPTFEL